MVNSPTLNESHRPKDSSRRAPGCKSQQKERRAPGLRLGKYLFAAGFGAFVSFQSSVCFRWVQDQRVQQLSPSVIPQLTETCRPLALVI